MRRQQNLSVPDATAQCAEILSQFSPANRAKAVLCLLALTLEDRPAQVIDVLDSAGLMYKPVKNGTNKRPWWSVFGIGGR